MANWAVVENNVITEYHSIVPLNWRHVSNIRASQEDFAFMASLGWYPIQYPQLDFDPTTHEIDSWNYSWTGSSITASATLRERITVPEEVLPPNPEQILRDRVTEAVQQYQSYIDEQGVSVVAEVLAQQDQQWRDRLRIQVEQKMSTAYEQQIAQDIANDTEFHAMLCDKVAQVLVDRVIYQKGDMFREMLQQHGWIGEAVDLESARESLLQTLRENFTSMQHHQRQIVDAHVNYISGLINFEELGRDEPENELDRVRLQRNKLLYRSDYTQAADMQQVMTQAQRDAWSAYRQALRDIPQQYLQNNGHVTWPETP